jgi:cytochrome c
VNGNLVVTLVIASWLAAGCSDDTASAGGDAIEELTAASLGTQSVLTAAEYLGQQPYAGADRDNGQRLAQMCKACHTVGAGGAHMIGPNLFGFFGRPAGSAERYAYSAVLQEADFVWTPRALDVWLARPARFLPGNRMSFPGVSSASDRVDVIAYLLDATSGQ